jgi:hypothetical protein
MSAIGPLKKRWRIVFQTIQSETHDKFETMVYDNTGGRKIGGWDLFITDLFGTGKLPDPTRGDDKTVVLNMLDAAGIAAAYYRDPDVDRQRPTRGPSTEDQETRACLAVSRVIYHHTKDDLTNKHGGRRVAIRFGFPQEGAPLSPLYGNTTKDDYLEKRAQWKKMVLYGTFAEEGAQKTMSVRPIHGRVQSAFLYRHRSGRLFIFTAWNESLAKVNHTSPHLLYEDLRHCDMVGPPRILEPCLYNQLLGKGKLLVYEVDIARLVAAAAVDDPVHAMFNRLRAVALTADCIADVAGSNDALCGISSGDQYGGSIKGPLPTKIGIHYGIMPDIVGGPVFTATWHLVGILVEANVERHAIVSMIDARALLDAALATGDEPAANAAGGIAVGPAVASGSAPIVPVSISATGPSPPTETDAEPVAKAKVPTERMKKFLGLLPLVEPFAVINQLMLNRFDDNRFDSHFIHLTEAALGRMGIPELDIVTINLGLEQLREEEKERKSKKK